MVPRTHREQVEHSLAAERRRMRLIHHDIMEDLLSNKNFQKSITEGMWCNSASSHCSLHSYFMYTVHSHEQLLPLKVVLLFVVVSEEDSRDEDEAVDTERTRVESVELVLPPHANHQVNTFGGQIMAWMENVATIAARCVESICCTFAKCTFIQQLIFSFFKHLYSTRSRSKVCNVDAKTLQKRI